jgi:dipicolinate synthase subunit A
MKPDVVIIDIASAPGGVDYPTAKELHVNCKLCLGLPGKFAPKSSAAFLVNHVLSNEGKKCYYVS